MTIALKHKFTSSKADGSDPTLVQPSNWNDDHELTLAQSRLIGRFSTGAGPAEEIGLDSLLEFSGGNLRLANAAALSVLGRSANSAGQMAAITAGTDGHVLRRVGSALGFYALSLSDVATTADAADYRALTPGRVIMTDSVSSGMAEGSLSISGGAISWAMSGAFNFSVSMTANATLQNPTATVVGKGGFFRFQQDGTGGRTLAIGGNIKTPNGEGITLSSAPNAVDYGLYICRSAGEVLLTLIRDWK